jgi:hypothetical protein
MGLWGNARRKAAFDKSSAGVVRNRWLLSFFLTYPAARRVTLNILFQFNLDWRSVPNLFTVLPDRAVR